MNSMTDDGIFFFTEWIYLLLLLLFWHRKLPKFHLNHSSHTHLYLFEKQWKFCGSQKCTLFIRTLNFPMEKLKVQIKLFVKINLNKSNAVFAGWTNTELCSTAYITRRALYSRSIVLMMCNSEIWSYTCNPCLWLYCRKARNSITNTNATHSRTEPYQHSSLWKIVFHVLFLAYFMFTFNKCVGYFDEITSMWWQSLCYIWTFIGTCNRNRHAFLFIYDMRHYIK